jgi:signal transduction histidine kinase
MTSVSDGDLTTAEVVIRLLEGEKPANIKTPPLEYGPAKFDWRQLQRWGIGESRLPPGSEVYFREPSAWQTYRWQIAIVSAVILLQAALISRLLYEQRRRRYAEVQSRQRSSELARVNRFSTAGELTATIGHEINQPLGAIHVNVETMAMMLESPAPDIDEIRQIVADIQRDEERASEVIRRLRSMLKKAPFEPKDIDLNDVVREAIEFLSALAIAREVNIRGYISPMPLPISGDRIQLQQVILNVIVNAMDAMSNMPSAERKITVSTARIDNLAEVSITDTGPGIPPDKLKDVFEPFFTTKANGMGMGLSIARTIVEAHGGRIWAESQNGIGAIFRIKLPLTSTD